MAQSPLQSKRVVVRANRDTLLLVAAATAATFALAYSIHARPPEDVVAAPPVVQQQDWTGELANVASAPTQTTVAEPLSTASLTVPKSSLTLPSVPTRAKIKPCDGSSCPPKGQHAAPPRGDLAAHPTPKDHGLIARLNPLNHLDTLQKPFVYAGNTISGWLSHF